MTTANSPQSFKLTWKGGFSYLTYLLKELTVTLLEQEVQVMSHSKILGIIPSGTKQQSLPYKDIQKVQLGTHINWFQLLFAVLFSVITTLPLLTGSGLRWVALIAAIVFFWLAFRSKNLILINRTGATIQLLSTSKGEIETLLECLVQQLDYTRTGQVPVVREGKAITAIIATCAALVITGISIFSFTMNEDQKYIVLVENSAIADSTNDPEPTINASSQTMSDSTDKGNEDDTSNEVTESFSEQSTVSKVQVIPADSLKLNNFVKWSPPDADLDLPLVLDGESVDVLIGMDSPNGIKTLAISQSLEQGWQLPLNIPQGTSGPFDEFGELRGGFSLYATEYDFEGDSVPEVVIVASDGLLETYIWVYSYNYVFSEHGTSPLDLIWYGEGQSDVVLEGNKILLPFGSQGLFDEYVYSNNTFIKQQ